MIIASYLADRNCLFVISAQEAPVVNYSSPDLLFQDVMKIEVGTSKALTDIYLMCLKEGDAITAAWIEGLLKEQIEEEDKVQTILDFIQLTGTTPPGLALLDEKVASLA
jgi:ferritin